MDKYTTIELEKNDNISGKRALKPNPLDHPIKQWDFIRKHRIDLVKKAFMYSGNYFSINMGNISLNIDYLHIYLGYNNGQLKLYVIPSASDQKPIQGNLYSIPFSSVKETIKDSLNQDIEELIGYDKSYQEYISWIQNWNDHTFRNNWIDEQYKNNPLENAIFQAFVIRTSDFMAGCIHNCYLSLKQISNSKPVKHVADLVVVNTNNNQVLNLLEENKNFNKTSIYRDVAQPVPPFPPNSDFGILSELGIS
ncbi:hypothetical protein [Aquimarina sp. 2201CG5-10]|uniref:hypothetical protein n=1 Tax=Aquimarina callyspongiae TaxID=3098150 RepID=UPI002AB36D6F|nr:hypothetical protein [Aquimarina sp. 2201CG5-10]MDY8138130.1 hypothetical protein [Aquimarina sp. 2201CG5-10]